MSFKWIGLSEDGDTVVLQKFKTFPAAPSYATPDWMTTNAAKVGLAAVVDVETNGLSPTDDDVIEIGMTLFRFNRENGDFLGVEEAYTALHDPGRPLPREIEELTGLTDEMLKGQTIDWTRVESLLGRAEVVIAHNAAFDRAFIEKNVPAASQNLWGCSLKQIDWSAKGFNVQKLDILAIYHGFFTDAHRALNDVNALVNLLIKKDPATGETYLAELLLNAKRPFVKLVAVGSPFESKDLLKRRRYKWDPAQRAWYKFLYKDEIQAEIRWLETSVYLGAFRGQTAEIPVTENFRNVY